MLHEPANHTGDSLALTHGAGGNCDSPLLVTIAEFFASAGVLVLRFNLAFRERRPNGPPSPHSASQDRDSIAAALDSLRPRTSRHLFLGGQSYGGRQASMLAAENPNTAASLLLLSFPLHPPGKPNQLRTEHFPRLRIPALFVHGAGDPFATTEELEAARALIPAPTTLLDIPAAGHDLARGRFPLEPVVAALLALAR